MFPSLLETIFLTISETSNCTLQDKVQICYTVQRIFTPFLDNQMKKMNLM